MINQVHQHGWVFCPDIKFSRGIMSGELCAETVCRLDVAMFGIDCNRRKKKQKTKTKKKQEEEEEERA